MKLVGRLCRAVTADVVKGGLARLWWGGDGETFLQAWCSMFRGPALLHSHQLPRGSAAMTEVPSLRALPFCGHSITSHAHRWYMCFSTSPTLGKSTWMWVYSESFLMPFNFFFFILPTRLLKNVLFKGITLPSSGSQRNFFLNKLLFLFKKNACLNSTQLLLNILIQNSY